MGHDISAFNKAEEPNEEIAYLRRSAFNSLNGAIYTALKAEDQNCGCSGCGNDPIHFSEAQLKEAKSRLPSGDDYEQEREFLDNCLTNGASGVWIGFW